ncbi:MAG: GTPase HflX [Acidobacteria bacterium]|nr:MAG: GTPase HflX [Acidobacteriota bacterium]
MCLLAWAVVRGGGLPGAAATALGEKRASDKTILVGVCRRELPRSVAEDHLDELARLVDTAGGRVVARSLQDRPAPDPATYVGKGKVAELAEAAEALEAGFVVFDDELTPSQVKNLEKALPARVLDRPAVILEIFASRARSREAMTQVELARLNYLLPRLAGSTSGLSQQRAGGMFRAGVGEKKIELDRRRIRRRIATLKEELARIEKGRAVRRRRLSHVATVALAGYTNAGKTTLFNRLTSSRELAEDRLFATLDPRHARLLGVGGRPIVVTDTVGFLRKLPHDLVASFRSTLSEVEEADVVVHVVDAASEAAEEERRVAEEVLSELGVAPERVLLVLNKSDLPGARSPGAEGMRVSAATGEGLDALRAAVVDRLVALGVPVPLPGAAPEAAVAP